MSEFLSPAVDYSSADGSGPWVNLPGAYRYGGRRRTREDTNISLETDYGSKFVYNLSTRFIYELHFRLSEDQVTIFETFNDAVAGEVIPFWFSLIGDGSDKIFVRKEPGFDPVELDTPGNDGGDNSPGSDFDGGCSMYDYVLHLTEDFMQLVESTSVNITY